MQIELGATERTLAIAEETQPATQVPPSAAFYRLPDSF